MVRWPVGSAARFLCCRSDFREGGRAHAGRVIRAPEQGTPVGSTVRAMARPPRIGRYRRRSGRPTVRPASRRGTSSPTIQQISHRAGTQALRRASGWWIASSARPTQPTSDSQRRRRLCLLVTCRAPEKVRTEQIARSRSAGSGSVGPESPPSRSKVGFRRRNGFRSGSSHRDFSRSKQSLGSDRWIGGAVGRRGRRRLPPRETGCRASRLLKICRAGG